MKKITAKERKNGMCWCKYCEGKVAAIWKHGGDWVCNKHKYELEDDEYLTEADYQTWARNYN